MPRGSLFVCIDCGYIIEYKMIVLLVYMTINEMGSTEHMI